MPYEFIGRTTYQRGKTLWELLGNLRNNGVGRIVARNQFEKNSPCYYRIVEVETLAPEGKIECLPPVVDLGNVRRVRALVDFVRKGKYMERQWLSCTTYKPDYKLIPKEEEESYTKVKKGELPEAYVKETIAPSHGKFPPLLREILMNEMKKSGKEVVEPILPLVYNISTRVAKDGEKPTFEVNSCSVAGRVSPFYADVRKSVKK